MEPRGNLGLSSAAGVNGAEYEPLARIEIGRNVCLLCVCVWSLLAGNPGCWARGSASGAEAMTRWPAKSKL